MGLILNSAIYGLTILFINLPTTDLYRKSTQLNNASTTINNP